MIAFLIVLIFLSKVALAFIPFVPWELGPVIYQRGLHPYINILLSVSLGSFVILRWLWYPNRFLAQSRFFRFSLVLASLYLLLITFLQAFFVNTQDALILQMGAAFLGCFTMVLFGRIIPTTLTPEKFLKLLKNITVILCWVSLVILILFPSVGFKGTRFIGVFKHIPHMVSCATLACFALMFDFVKHNLSKRQWLLTTINFMMSFALLVLTGTRSALASVSFGLILLFIVFPARSNANRFLKLAVTMTALLVVLFFGDDLTREAVNIATGQTNIGGRTAQDGVSSRIEEMERGYQIFQKNQWLGQGLLSKFSSSGEAEVSNYDANKDPHNIFFSAGVIGGWGFIALTTVLLFGLIIASLKSLRSKNDAVRVLAIYVLSQIPILIIYHVHISIGGIADRIYWIVFGYMALKEQDIQKIPEKSS